MKQFLTLKKIKNFNQRSMLTHNQNMEWAKTLTKPMLKISEVAKLLGVSQETIRRWSKKGIIDEIRSYERAHRRFRFNDIEKLLNKN
jgi:excisionase family DNA binding protein